MFEQKKEFYKQKAIEANKQEGDVKYYAFWKSLGKSYQSDGEGKPRNDVNFGVIKTDSSLVGNEQMLKQLGLVECLYSPFGEEDKERWNNILSSKAQKSERELIKELQEQLKELTAKANKSEIVEDVEINDINSISGKLDMLSEPQGEKSKAGRKPSK